MTRWRMALAVVVAMLAFQIVLLAAYRAYDSARERPRGIVRGERVPKATPAPVLRLERADGRADTVSFDSGRPVFVHFWATWCPPCRHEMPLLLAMSSKLARTSGVETLAISADPGWAQIRAFFDGEVPAEIRRDPDGSASRAFGVTELPDTYLVGADGMLQWRFAGSQDWRSVDVPGLLGGR